MSKVFYKYVYIKYPDGALVRKRLPVYSVPDLSLDSDKHIYD